MRKALLSILAGLAMGVLASASAAAPPKSLIDDGATCTTAGGKACKVGSFCKREYGVCIAVPKGEGVCSPIPDICSDEVRTVCGCNGKTYDNPCLAEIDDANIAHEGSCNSTDEGKDRR